MHYQIIIKYMEENKYKIFEESYTQDAIKFQVSDGSINYAVLIENPTSYTTEEYIRTLHTKTIDYITNSTFPNLVLEYPNMIVACKKSN